MNACPLPACIAEITGKSRVSVWNMTADVDGLDFYVYCDQGLPVANVRASAPCGYVVLIAWADHRALHWAGSLRPTSGAPACSLDLSLQYSREARTVQFVATVSERVLVVRVTHDLGDSHASDEKSMREALLRIVGLCAV